MLIVNFILILLLSMPSFAEEVENFNYPAFEVSIANMALETPAGDFSRRRGYILGYKQPLYKNFHLSLLGQFAPDSRKKSQRLNVNQDFQYLSTLFGVSYPFLFRVGLSTGPTYIRSTTHYDFDSSSSRFHVSEVGWAYRLTLDYAMAQCCEISVAFAQYNRSSEHKIDRSYSLGFIYNADFGFRTRSFTW